MSTARLTTTIAPDLLNFLNQESHKKNTTKRFILEEALKDYKKEVRRRKILKGCNQMAEDKDEMEEWVSIANNSTNLL